MVSRIVTQVARESFGFAAFAVSVWENTTLPKGFKKNCHESSLQVKMLDSSPFNLLRFERERIQLVYEIILLNKILRNHLLSETIP